MSFFEKIKEYESCDMFEIIKSDDYCVIKEDNIFTFLHRPTDKLPKGRIIEFTDESYVIKDTEFSEKKAEWIEANLHIKGKLND